MRGIKTKESGKFKRFLIFIVLFLIFAVLANSVRKVYLKKEGAQEALARMENEIKELTARQEALKRSLTKLETSEGIEFEIRKKLNVAEVGESVAIIVDEETSSTTESSSPSAWQKFKNFFTGLFE